MSDTSSPNRTPRLRFFGRFRLKLDAKGRLTLPSIYRRELGGEDEWLVLRPGSDGFVQVIPIDQWQELQAERRLSSTGVGRGRDRQWERRLEASEVSMTPLDLKGRMTVPRDLLEKSGIQKDVLILGVGKHLELWDPTTFFEAAEGHDIDGGSIDDLLYD